MIRLDLSRRIPSARTRFPCPSCGVPIVSRLRRYTTRPRTCGACGYACTLIRRRGVRVPSVQGRLW